MVNSSDYKLVVLGSGAVGKSSLTIQFIQGNFVERYDPTIEDSYRKQIAVDGKPCTLDILDTAGQEEYATMRDAYMRGGAGFILVYSITDKASFDDLWSIHAHLLKTKDAEEVPIVLVGNKCDLEDERQVSKEDGKKMAERFGEYCCFMESSAKERINVEEAFIEIVRLVNSERDEGEEEDHGKGKDKKKDAKKDSKKDAKKDSKKDAKKDKEPEEDGAGGKRKSLFGKKKKDDVKPDAKEPEPEPESKKPAEPKKITIKDRSKKEKDATAPTEPEPKSPSVGKKEPTDETPSSPMTKKPAEDEDKKKKEEERKKEEEEKKAQKKREEEEKKRAEEEKKEQKKREEEEKKQAEEEKKREKEEQKKREEEEKREQKKREEEEKKRIEEEKKEQKKREEEEKREEKKRKGTMSRKAAAAAATSTSTSPNDETHSPISRAHSAAQAFSSPYVPGKLGVPRLSAFEFEHKRSPTPAPRGSAFSTKISYFDIGKDKKDKVEDLTSVDALIIQKIPTSVEYRWINIQEYSPEILNKIASKFGIHQSTVDDILSDPDMQKTRFEISQKNGYLYFVCRRFSQIKQTQFVDNVHVLIFEKLIITFQTINNDGNEERIQFHSRFWNRVKSSIFDEDALYKDNIDPTFLLLPIVEAIVETAADSVQGCADMLDDIERKLFESGRSAELNKQTFVLSRLLYLFKRSLNYTATTIQELSELPETKFKLSQDLKVQLSSVQPLIADMIEMLDTYNGLAHMCFAFSGGRTVPTGISTPSGMSVGPSLADAEEEEEVSQGKKSKSDKCRVS